MTGDDPRLAALDARLRRLFAGLDAREGFEQRLAARIAAADVRPRADLREQFERRRELVARRLRREAWLNSISAAGIGAAALLLYGRYAQDFARWFLGALPAADPAWLAGGTLAVLAACVTPLVVRVRV